MAYRGSKKGFRGRGRSPKCVVIVKKYYGGKKKSYGRRR